MEDINEKLLRTAIDAARRKNPHAAMVCRLLSRSQVSLEGQASAVIHALLTHIEALTQHAASLRTWEPPFTYPPPVASIPVPEGGFKTSGPSEGALPLTKTTLYTDKLLGLVLGSPADNGEDDDG